MANLGILNSSCLVMMETHWSLERSNVRSLSCSLLTRSPPAYPGIIVRDEAAKERLHQEVGEELGLIMYVYYQTLSSQLMAVSRTIYESKGLEFNDVNELICLNNCSSC